MGEENTNRSNSIPAITTTKSTCGNILSFIVMYFKSYVNDTHEDIIDLKKNRTIEGTVNALMNTCKMDITTLLTAVIYMNRVLNVIDKDRENFTGLHIELARNWLIAAATVANKMLNDTHYSNLFISMIANPTHIITKNNRLAACYKKSPLEILNEQEIEFVTLLNFQLKIETQELLKLLDIIDIFIQNNIRPPGPIILNI